MSMITLQFGQCGNQIGQVLYSTLCEDIKGKKDKSPYLNKSYVSEAVNRWFYVNRKEQWEPMSILIDTETKVISQDNNLPVKFRRIVAESYGGCANNWAFGYLCQSNLLVGEIMEYLRLEMERCDYVTDLLSISSTGGGTGSGIGTKVAELIREEHPKKTLLNAVVLPYKTGEVVTQNYNTLLSLARLYDVTDALLLFENDRLHHICRNLMQTKVDFQDLNSVIANQLAGTFQPVKLAKMTYLISDLASHPSHKIIQIQSNPYVTGHGDFKSEMPWKSLLTNLLKKTRSDYLCNMKDAPQKMKYIGNVFITRGKERPRDDEFQSSKEKLTFVSWVPKEAKLQQYHQMRNFLNFDKFAVLLSNDTNVCNSLNFVLQDAWTLFTHGAYLHHYKKYGASEQCFLDAFEKLETLLHNYKML